MELPMPKTRTCDDAAGDAAHFIVQPAITKRFWEDVYNGK